MTQHQRDIKRKLAVLQHARESGNVALIALRVAISRQCYDTWRRACEEQVPGHHVQVDVKFLQLKRADGGHEFQAELHWHVEDLGLRHVYIKPRSPDLNGKVERSHLTDQLGFYQLLDYTAGVSALAAEVAQRAASGHLSQRVMRPRPKGSRCVSLGREP